MIATCEEGGVSGASGGENRLPRTPLSIVIAQLIVIPISVVEFGAISAAPFIGLGLLAGWLLYSMRQDAFWRRLFLFAAFYGTIGEAICVYGDWTISHEGLWIYRFPPSFGFETKLPFWIPLVWGNLFTLFVSIAARVDDFSRSLNSARAREGLRFIFILLIISYAGVMYRRVDLRILVFFTPFFAAFLLWWNRIHSLVIFVVAAAIGSFGEVYAMSRGYWFYTKPMFRNEWIDRIGIPGIPVSLAMAWGLSAVFLYHVARRSTRWRGY